MPKYFMQGTELESLEKMMMSVPRHYTPEEDERPRSRRRRRSRDVEENDDLQSGTEQP